LAVAALGSTNRRQQASQRSHDDPSTQSSQGHLRGKDPHFRQVAHHEDGPLGPGSD
jgi:hypothetical protein